MASAQVCWEMYNDQLGWIQTCDSNLFFGLQAFTVYLSGAPAGAGVCYQAYIEGSGWQAVVCDGGVAGTPGVALGGMRIWLTQSEPGAVICYRASVDGEWLANRCDGDASGMVTAYGIDNLIIEYLSATSVTDRPVVALSSANPGERVRRDLCLQIAAGSDASYECGALRAHHPLPSVTTMSRLRAPVLTYSSEQGDPYPVIRAEVTRPLIAEQPDSAVAILWVDGVERARGSWTGTDWAPGATRQIALGFGAVPSAAWPTGIYSYTLEVSFWSNAAGKNATTVSAPLAIVNRGEGEFGRGWWLAGLERLDVDTKLWIGGDGSVRQYEPVGPDRWIARSVDRPDTLRRVGAYYERILAGGDLIRFDAVSGRHVASVNRLGQETAFSYDAGRLHRITLPVVSGTAPCYEFHYTSGTLSSVSAPGVAALACAPGNRRITQLYATGARVDSIQDPDGTRVRFAYDGNRIAGRTDRRGTVTTYAYAGGANRLSQVRVDPTGLDLTTTFTPAETRGLAAATIASSVAASEAYTLLDGPRSDVADHTRFWIDRFGAVSKIRTALGDSTVLTRGLAAFPALVTGVRHANGYEERATYDARGNLSLSIRINPYGKVPAQNDTTRYVYGSSGLLRDFVHRIVLPERDSTVYGYLSNGNVEWHQPGSDTSRRWTYQYHASHLLWRVDPPGAQPAEVLAYDAQGNLTSLTSALGFVTSYENDALGRTIATLFPPEPSRSHRRSVEYDVADRVVHTRDTGVTSGDTMWTAVRHTYDASGNLTQSRTWGRSGSADSISAGISAWTYDAAGRVQVSQTPVSADTMVYDPAGNVVRSFSRGDTLTMTYDAQNRLLSRHVPQKFFATETTAEGWTFPAYAPSGLTIPEDVQSFTYDEVGNLRTANNLDARISRRYHPGGEIRADTLAIRNYASSDYTTFVYGLGFTYDRNGRRTAVQHPGLIASGTGSTGYTYHGMTGELASVTDPLGGTYGFSYDVVGQPTVMSFPAGVDSMTYDFDGRMTGRRVRAGSPSALLLGETIAYDRMGRITQVGSGSVQYNGLGHVTGTSQVGSVASESFTRDPFGNAVYHYTVPPAANPEQSATGFTNWHPAETGGRLATSTLEWTMPGIPMPNGWFPSTRSHIYDVWANLTRTTSYDHTFTYSGGLTGYESAALADEHRSLSRSYYGRDRRLRVHQVSRDSVDHRQAWNPRYGQPWGAYEEYRYDALGRRVLKRSRQESPVCTDFSRCHSAIERYVWDGDQLLWEVRQGGAGEFANPGAGDQSGTIGYVHAGGIDAPLGMIRNGATVVLHRNWRGLYAFATDAAGQPTTCAPLEPAPPCTGGRPYLSWPGTTWNVLLQSPLHARNTQIWYGSLALDQQDRSGLLYRRNRYYNSSSGQFTQPDPIGIAGGLNLYGYAGGDPINFSDPFGLCPGEGQKWWDCVKEFANYQWRGFQAGADPTRFSVDFETEGQLGAILGRALLSGGGGRIGGAGPGLSTAEMSGMLRSAARGKGNFGLGNATRAEANALGRAWVGEGATVTSGGIMVSANSLRQFRPPSFKPKLGYEQANLEWRLRSGGQWQGNAHITIWP